jgi:hypothetical protein
VLDRTTSAFVAGAFAAALGAASAYAQEFTAAQKSIRAEQITERKVVVYYAWSRAAEIGAPLEVIENRFPTLFENRRMGFPRFEKLADPARLDQSIAGFLDHIVKRNFADFFQLAALLTDHPVTEIERLPDGGHLAVLDAGMLDGCDTLIIISFDPLRTGQTATDAEIEAMRKFLARPDHLAFVCPHHDIGDVPDLPHEERLQRQFADFRHHGERTIPPQQQFGGFARSLLAGLGVPVENRFGLHPATEADGSPAPIETEPT